jgi:hypothetical protein
MINRPFIIGLVGVGLLIIGAGAAWFTLQDSDDKPAPQVSASRASPSPSPQATSTPVAPSFDVVRINPAGDAVMAGRATPDAVVTILDGDREIGQVTADARGEWVFVPNEPLPAGSRELSLSARVGDRDLRSDQVVVLAVPERGRDLAGQPAPEGSQPLVVATSRAGRGASTLLQSPGRAGSSGLSLDIIDYDSDGALVLSGRAPPRTVIQVYIDNRPLGRATADADGNWRLTPVERVPVGSYAVRLDELSADGRVAMRIEVPFVRAEMEPDSTLASQVMVKSGDSLWRIARRVHGRGIAYLLIYQGNRDQIRDPDLIYPGQVFTLSRSN